MIKIAIADDHPMVLKGLMFMLSDKKEICVTSTYTSGQALLAGLQHEQPDVLLLDVLFDDCTAEDILPQVVENYPTIRVLIITSISNIPRVRNLIRMGCLGYLLKNESEATLIGAIETVNRGLPFVSEALRQQIDQEKSDAQRKMPVNGQLLTRREKETLQLIVQGYTSKEIAFQLFISLNTVETHRKNLFLKLDVKNVAALLQKATALGLIE